MNLLPLNGQGITALYLLASVCFILALKGLSSPKGARNGNLLGAFGALVAVVATFLVDGLHNRGIMAAAIAVGVLVGVPAARVVKMTQMPQMVALFNGVGGGAVALIAWVEFRASGGFDGVPTYVTVFSVFAAIVGSVSFWGSNIAFAKLQGLIDGGSKTIAGPKLQAPINAALGLVAVGSGVAIAAGAHSEGLMVLLLVAAALLGNFLVLPIGGADMPVVISLLNAFTGLSAAATGVALNNTSLIVAGMIVGASGTLLTQQMALAMNRTITSVIAGGFGGTVEAAAGAVGAGGGTVRSTSAADVAIQMAYARLVVVVPGYGMAVSQAQHAVKELANELEKKGVTVNYAIHPVAGRMPGHMNVLLAEANVPYDQLYELEAINDEFAQTDVAIIV
ncbi:MAG: H+-translocating transhydrogenase subunit beta, partial [Frankiaceae bacterium]|nr:H+-translocating transhydrogenase subunit beta [Frankiaceae bacterium]